MQVDDVKRKYLLWGALLAWPPFLLIFLILAVTVIGEIAEQKATGMGAVAGGVAEAFTLYVLAGAAGPAVLRLAGTPRQHRCG